MKKPKNRKERIDFLIQKEGLKVTQLMVSFTDSEVKRHFDYRWNGLKDKPDYTGDERQFCSRCNEEVLWISECGCGENRAVFDEESWCADIEGNTMDTGWLKEINDKFLQGLIKDD